MLNSMEFEQIKQDIPGARLFDFLLFKENRMHDLRETGLHEVLLNEPVGNWFWEVVINKKLDFLANIAMNTEFIDKTNYYQDLRNIARNLGFAKLNDTELMIYVGAQYEDFQQGVADHMLKLNPQTIMGNSTYRDKIMPMLSEKQQANIAYMISDLSTTAEIYSDLFTMYRENKLLSGSSPLMSNGAQHILLSKLSSREINSFITQTLDPPIITTETFDKIWLTPLPPREGPNPNIAPDGSEYIIVG